ncbi:MAG: hypothetical protein QOF26_3097 [Baekduia sp.]|jgi:hypothetical protein|nr:hypothetical protein [Baekduia sp.]
MMAPASMASGQDPTAITATDWERRIDDLSRRLREVQAELAFAEQELERVRDPGRPPIRLVPERGDAPTRELEELTSPAPSRPSLEVLGRDGGRLHVGGRTIELSRRHTEIVVLLARNPNGMTTEQLAVALHGEAGRPASVRVELCRLRKIAPEILSDRNRVMLEMEADFLIVQQLLRAGRPLEAAQRYPAALLPGSEAPGIVDARDELDAWMRSAVMTSDDPAALWAWLESGSGWDDALAWKRFLADLDFADPRRPLAVTRLARLRTALTVVR